MPHTARCAMAVAILVLAACAATATVTTEFRDPSVRALSFNKIAAVGISTDGPQRRLAEGGNGAPDRTESDAGVAGAA